MDSQFRDKGEPRRMGNVGQIVDIDESDEWSYFVKFHDGKNWFKRYHLRLRKLGKEVH